MKRHDLRIFGLQCSRLRKQMEHCPLVGQWIIRILLGVEHSEFLAVILLDGQHVAELADVFIVQEIQKQVRSHLDECFF